MAGNVNGKAEVKCPFYISHQPSGERVICEGAARGSKITIQLKTKDRLNRYMERVCMDITRWHACPYAAMVAYVYQKRAETTPCE